MPIGSVITGDIVNSMLLNMDRIKSLELQYFQITKGNLFEFYRGDSFQAYIKEPKHALKIALQLRIAAKKIDFVNDARLSIGIGEVNLPMKSIKNATGDAFVLSGRAFDSMADNQRIIIQTSNNTVNLGFVPLAEFTDYLIKNLTPKQAEVIFELLSEHTQLETADKLNKSQATINKHAKSANWANIESLLNAYRDLINQLK